LPQGILEWIWWPVFALWCFLPGGRTPLIDLGLIQINLQDLVVGCLGLCCVPLIFLRRNRYPRVIHWTFLPFTGLVAYAIGSALLEGGLRQLHLAYVLFPAMGAWLAMCLGLGLVLSLRPNDLQRFALRLSYALAVVIIIYMYVNVFATEAREVDPLLNLPRLRGPLGVSTMLPAVLVIAISCLVIGIRLHPWVAFRVAAACILAMGILLGGSRAGVLALAVLAAAVMFRGRSMKSRVAMVAALAVAVFIFAEVETFTRFLVFEDLYREQTYRTGMAFWLQSPGAMVFGIGYGQLWPWYLYEVEVKMGLSGWRYMMMQSGMGRMAGIPHSTFVPILVEMGVVGLAIFLTALSSQLVPSLGATRVIRLSSIIAPGIVAGLVIMMFDMLLLKGFQLAVVWWAFFFLMAADHSLQVEDEAKQPSAVAKSRRLIQPRNESPRLAGGLLHRPPPRSG
jgi:hypothetical protein